MNSRVQCRSRAGRWIIVDTPRVLFYLASDEPNSHIREASRALVGKRRIDVVVATTDTFGVSQVPRYDVVVADDAAAMASGDQASQARLGWVMVGDVDTHWEPEEQSAVRLRRNASSTQICDAVISLLDDNRPPGEDDSGLDVLLVDGDASALESVGQLLASSGVPIASTRPACSLKEAQVAIMTRPPDVIIADLSLPDSTGLDTVQALRASSPTTAMVVLAEDDDENTALQSVLLGADDYLVKSQVDRRELWRSLRYATQRKRFEHRVAYLSQFDRLTGLLNRFSFAGRLSDSVRRAHLTGQEIVLLIIDLDRFKAVRKWLSHDDADSLIKEVAGRIRQVVPDAASIARQGEDEFAVMLENAGPGHRRAGSVGRSILTALRKPFPTSSGPLTCTASLGAAVFPEAGNTVEALVRTADAAVMSAKSRGRNTLHIASGLTATAPVSQLRLEHALRRSLREETFDVHLQPIYDLYSGGIYSCEALLRWEDGEDMEVSPEQVVRTLENTGLIGEVGRLILRRALNRVAALRKRPGFEHLKAAVNLSPIQFTRESLIDEVVEELSRANLPTDALEIEVTESVVLDLSLEVKGALQQFKALGINIAIDDFGTGYSSLAYLSRFRCDVLKIDREFTRNIGTAEGEASLRAIIGLARELGVQVVAEGVEEREQLEFLVAEGCQRAQGFLLAKPALELGPEHATTRLIGELSPPRDLFVDSTTGSPAHVLAALPEAVLEFDATGRLVATYGRSSWIDIPLGDAIGKSLVDVFPPLHARSLLAAIRRALTTSLVQVVQFVRERPKGPVYFEARLSRTATGTVLMNARGISEWVRTRKQLQVRTGQLLRAHRQLEQFAFLVHRELNEPVSTALAHLEALRSAWNPDSAQERSAAELADEIKRVERIVDGLVSMSEGGHSAMGRVDLHAVVDDVVSALSARLAEQRAIIRPRRLPVVRGAPWQLRIALAALCENALSHGEATRIDITGRLHNGWWEVVVRDNGKGISPEALKGIFNPFVKGADSDGLGIGLTLCRRIFRRHGGDVKVLDTSSHGTSFTLRLPPTE